MLSGIVLGLMVGCGRDRFVPLDTQGCETSLFDVFPLSPDPQSAIEVHTPGSDNASDARFLAYEASDFVGEDPTPDTLFFEGGPVGCHSGSSECRSFTSKQAWCDADADEPWSFEIRARIADTPVAVQGTEVSADHMGCTFDFTAYELEHRTAIGQGVLETFLCDAWHDNWKRDQ